MFAIRFPVRSAVHSFVRHALLVGALLIGALLPTMTSAQSLSLAEVLRETLSNHPDIPLAQLNSSFVQTEQERIGGMLDTRVSGRLGASDETTPTTSPFAADQTQVASFSGAVNQPLSDGSQLTGSINYSRTKLNYPASVPTAFQSTLNPIYGNQIDLTYRYPLLRGHGNPAYHELLSASKSDEASAQWRVEMLKEALAGQAIALYYQLAIEELSLNISSDAIARAEKLLQYQQYREQYGLIEKADRLQAEALLATRRMEKSSAEAAVIQARTSLNRLMTRNSDTSLSPSADEAILGPQQLALLNSETVVKNAVDNRPVFKSLEARLAAADARLVTAQDQHDTQVDLVGQIGSRALENRAGSALGKGFTLNDRFISLSVELSDTLNGRATNAGIKQAELARQQILLEKVQATEALTSELSTAMNRLLSGNNTLLAAKRRQVAEAKKFDAEIKRYKEGRSNTATIVQFEGELQMAELQVALQKTSLQLATHQFKLAQGTLLNELLDTRSNTKTAAQDRPQ